MEAHDNASVEELAQQYGYSARHVARYLRVSKLIKPLQKLVDENRIPLISAVDVSYLSEDEQQIIYEAIEALGAKLRPRMAELLRQRGGEITADLVEQLIDSMLEKKPSGDGVMIRLSDRILKKYFKGMSTEQMAEIMEQALDAWFSGRGRKYFSWEITMREVLIRICLTRFIRVRCLSQIRFFCHMSRFTACRGA